MGVTKSSMKHRRSSSSEERAVHGHGVTHLLEDSSDLDGVLEVAWCPQSRHVRAASPVKASSSAVLALMSSSKVLMVSSSVAVTSLGVAGKDVTHLLEDSSDLDVDISEQHHSSPP